MKRKVIYAPIKIFSLYISVTLLLFFFGPIQYEGVDKVAVFWYIFFFLILFVFGFIFGISDTKYDKRVKKNMHSIYSNRMANVLMFVKLCILLTVSIRFVQVAMLFLQGGVNLSVSNIGNAYSQAYSGYVRGVGGYSADFIIKIFTYTPFLVSIILGSYYFKRLNILFKLSVVFTFLSVLILETLADGKQKEVGDLLIFIIVVLILKSDLNNRVKRKKIIRKISVIGFLGLLLFFFILKMRYDAIGVDGLNIQEKSTSLVHYNTNHLVFRVFGPFWGFAIAAFSGYLVQGYYGLSLSLKLPFVWTYFLGSSYAVTVLLHKLLGLPIYVEDTYPYRVGEAYGWGQRHWHSSFSWFAGDFTFTGTLFLFSFFAFIYARVWKDAFKYKNPFAVILFTYLTLGVVFIPANNQLFHSPESALAVIVLFILWIIYRGRYNFVV